MEYVQEHGEGQHKRHRCIANVLVLKKGEIGRETRRTGAIFMFLGARSPVFRNKIIKKKVRAVC